jgi:hypothetical protein
LTGGSLSALLLAAVLEGVWGWVQLLVLRWLRR